MNAIVLFPIFLQTDFSKKNWPFSDFFSRNHVQVIYLFFLTDSSGSTIFQVAPVLGLTESQQQLLLYFLALELEQDDLNLADQTYDITSADVAAIIPSYNTAGWAYERSYVNSRCAS